MNKLCLILLTMLLFPLQYAYAQEGKQNILFFGDSITAGYGIDENQAFPALIQQKIDSLGWNYSVQNGGLSGETSAGGLRRVDWMLQKKVDVFVLELGGNDGLRGLDLQSTRKNLQEIIEKVRAKYPEAVIILAGMKVPPNLGTNYTQEFKALYPALAEDEDVALISFLLEGVGGKASMMQADGIHPTPEGHARIAKTVWDTLEPILARNSQE
jgi:acyl-CoA thioesterase-1